MAQLLVLGARPHDLDAEEAQPWAQAGGAGRAGLRRLGTRPVATLADDDVPVPAGAR